MLRKIWTVLGCLFAFALLLLVVTLPRPKNTEDLPSSSQGESTQPSYLVKAYQGKVAVFRFGEEVPLEVRDSHVDQFPEADRDLLKQGIPVHSEEELQRILEDYSE